MSIRTTYHRCIRCGKPIPFNPSVGKLASYCPRCLASQRTVGGRSSVHPLCPKAEALRKELHMSIYKPGRPTKYDPSTGVGTKPPASAGEYRIRDNRGDIVYIGETNNLQRRTNEHIRSGKLVTGTGPHSTIEYKVASADSTSATRRAHEQQKIAQHKPALNKSRGGEGRPAGN